MNRTYLVVGLGLAAALNFLIVAETFKALLGVL